MSEKVKAAGRCAVCTSDLLNVAQNIITRLVAGRKCHRLCVAVFGHVGLFLVRVIDINKDGARVSTHSGQIYPQAGLSCQS